MKNKAVIRLLAMMTTLFYTAALAQAGQVITQADRSWAKKAIQQEKSLGATSDSNAIAVLYFNNKSGEDKLNALQKGMAVMLISDLSKVDQIQVVERVRMQALLDEMDLGASGLVDAATTPKVGKLLGASYVASGDILAGKTHQILIDSAVLEIIFETLTRQPIVTGALDELFRLEKEILFNIIDQMRVSVSPAMRLELEKPLSASTAALLALFYGIEHSDKGQYAEAAKMYQQALSEDPNLEMAKNALQELKSMGLSTTEELAKVEELPANPPVEAEGSSIGTYVVVGLGIAAIGGAAVALSSSGSGGDSSSSPAAPTVDTTAPVASPSPDTSTALNCAKGSVSFSFSKSMMETGSANISPSDFADSQGWSGNNYVISWSNDTSVCSAISSVRITLNGFMDTTENALSSPTVFEYSVD